MADNFTPMGGVPDFYAELLGAAQQQLVQLPDGSYVPAPQFGQPTSLSAIYDGILPSPDQRDNSSSWRTAQGRFLDPSWRPAPALPPVPPPVRAAGAQPATTVGVQPAGSTQMPPGVRPAAVDLAFASMGVQPTQQVAAVQPPRLPMPMPQFPVKIDPMGRYNAPPGPVDLLAKDQDRLTPNATAQDDAFMAAFYPGKVPNPALAAINAQAGGAMPRLPMALPPGYAPRMPQASGMPRMPMPMPTGMGVPQAPSGNSHGLSQGGPGNYTIRKGDTLWDLSQSAGVSVSDLLALNPQITDANRINAGAKLTLPQLPLPPSSSSSSSSSSSGTSSGSSGGGGKPHYNPDTNLWEY